MKSMEARFAEMTDKQIVAEYMTLVGTIWAYNETDYFIGRDIEDLVAVVPRASLAITPP